MQAAARGGRVRMLHPCHLEVERSDDRGQHRSGSSSPLRGSEHLKQPTVGQTLARETQPHFQRKQMAAVEPATKKQKQYRNHTKTMQKSFEIHAETMQTHAETIQKPYKNHSGTMQKPYRNHAKIIPKQLNSFHDIPIRASRHPR